MHMDVYASYHARCVSYMQAASGRSEIACGTHQHAVQAQHMARQVGVHRVEQPLGGWPEQDAGAAVPPACRAGNHGKGNLTLKCAGKMAAGQGTVADRAATTFERQRCALAPVLTQAPPPIPTSLRRRHRFLKWAVQESSSS